MASVPKERIHNCLNCGHGLGGGIFCPACGQRNLHRRLNWIDLKNDVSEQILEANLPWIRSLRELTLRPGKACLDYIHGKRIIHVNPIKYALYAIVLLTLSITGEKMFMDTIASDANYPRRFLLQNFPFYALLVTPVTALGLKLVFWTRPRNYVESWVFTFFMIGQAAMLMLVSRLLEALLEAAITVPEILPVPITLGFLVYMSFATRSFFEVGLVRALLSIMFISFITLYVGAIGWFSLGMGWDFFLELIGLA